MTKQEEQQQQSNTDKLYYAYEQLHSVLSSNQKSPDFDGAVNNFLLHIGSSQTLKAEHYFLVSLLEYLHYEAPEDEQNLFMVVEMIEAGIKEGYHKSDLDRLFDMLREKDANHIALFHYEKFKSIAGEKVNNFVASCRKYFSPIGNKGDIFKYINDEKDIEILSKIIIKTYAENEHNPEKLYNYFTGLYNASKENKKPIRVSDINFELDGIDRLREFYAGVGSDDDHDYKSQSVSFKEEKKKQEERNKPQSVSHKDGKKLNVVQEEVEVVELFDANGESLVFELLSTVEEKGNNYLVLTPFVEDESKIDLEVPAEVFVMQEVVKEGDEKMLEPVANENLVQEIFGKFKEDTKGKYDFFEDTNSKIREYNLKLVPINEELKRYFSKHPDKLYNLTPRKFEELVADILKDFGFDVELTSATRDGGFDIYAYMKTQIGIFLTFVECKRWTPPNHVGIEVVQRLQGVQHTNNAHKSMIVTTSFFTQPAILESKKHENLMTLVDYNNLKNWLENYH